jgi:hypothetical protein
VIQHICEYISPKEPALYELIASYGLTSACADHIGRHLALKVLSPTYTIHAHSCNDILQEIETRHFNDIIYRPKKYIGTCSDIQNRIHHYIINQHIKPFYSILLSIQNIKKQSDLSDYAYINNNLKNIQNEFYKRTSKSDEIRLLNIQDQKQLVSIYHRLQQSMDDIKEKLHTYRFKRAMRLLIEVCIIPLSMACIPYITEYNTHYSHQDVKDTYTIAWIVFISHLIPYIKEDVLQEPTLILTLSYIDSYIKNIIQHLDKHIKLKSSS